MIFFISRGAGNLMGRDEIIKGNWGMKGFPSYCHVC